MFFKLSLMSHIIVQGLKMYKKRVAFFDEEAPTEDAIESEAVKLMRAARATIIEKNFFDALARPLITPDARKEEVNGNVSKMDGADVTIDMINPTLWRFCQQVVAGQPLV
mgnify:CR=1 FL=1